MNFFKKYPYLYEIPILFILLFWAAQIFSPDLLALNNTEPHPFWLILLLIALRYGLSAGILAGSASAAVFLIYSWHYSERYLFEDFQFYILPGLFLFVGGALGLVGQKFKDQILNLEAENAQIKELQKNTQTEVESQKNINLQLEKKIVSKSSTLITLYEGARRFDNLNLDELYSAILEFILKNLEASQGLIYILENNEWKLKSSLGFTEAIPQSELLDYLNLVNYQKRSLSIRELLQNNPKLTNVNAPLLMGPLKKGEEGELKAVLLVYALPFQNLSSTTLNLFSFLLLWASRAIGRSFEYEAQKKLQMFDSVLHVFSENYFESRLAEEFERAKTYYLPLSLGRIIISADSLTALQKEYFLKGLSQILKETLRPMDVIAYSLQPSSRPLSQFAFMLITTSAAQAEVYKTKIIQNMKVFLEGWKESSPEISIALALSHYVPQLKTLEEWQATLVFEKI